MTSLTVSLMNCHDSNYSVYLGCGSKNSAILAVVSPTYFYYHLSTLLSATVVH